MNMTIPSEPTAEAKRQEDDFKQRSAKLMDALGHLPQDGVTVSALIDVAVSTALVVTLDPSAARVMFETRMRDYERHWAASRKLNH